MNKNAQIFCDMDGVLVDFETAILELLKNSLDGNPLPNSKRTAGYFIKLENIKKELGHNWRPEKGSDLKIPVVRNFMFYTVGLNPGPIFANMPSYEDGISELWPYLNSTGNIVNLLTAPIRHRKGATTTSEEGKNIWASRLTPSPSSIIISPANKKSNYAVINGVKNILIDDKNTTIQSWIDAGGIGILHTPKNSKETIRQLKMI